MRFSWISLLDSAALGLRVERENVAEPELGQITAGVPKG
jgi:hypothetical protein